MEVSGRASLDANVDRPVSQRGSESDLLHTLKTLLFFTVLMITLPLALLFASEAFFESSMEMSSIDGYYYATIIAVLAVHFVLALFVYVACKEDVPKGKNKNE